MKIIFLLSALLLSSHAHAAPADFIGNWQGQCAQASAPNGRSQMNISFTAEPALTLHTWGVSLASGMVYRVEGSTPASLLFSGGNALAAALDVKFDQDRSPQIKWKMKRTSAGLSIETTKYSGGKLLPGTLWRCSLNR